MAAFDENLVREYFELNGFFVRQLRNHTVQSRKKQVEATNDLVVFNPSTPESAGLSSFQLFASDMTNLRGAVVGIKGWNESRFSPAILKSSSKTFDFLKKEVIAKSDLYFQTDEPEDESTVDPYADYKRLIVVPAFPTNDQHRVDCAALFQEKGVHGVIVVSTILESLLRNVAVNHSYSKSEILQLLRVLKIYDMIREPQMTLF
ncbi:MAG TPA: hypothetical protein DCX06_08765 [Opitutae bacterium]|nr:hypothetical protein [Opitutae bacterium]